MVRFSDSLVKGMSKKGGILAAIAGLIVGFGIGWYEALSVVLGELFFCADILAMSWLLKRMLDPSKGHRLGSIVLSLLFLLKLLVLFGLAYYFLAVVGLSPAGLAGGVILGLGVLSWQVVTTPPQEDTPEQGEGGEEE